MSLSVDLFCTKSEEKKGNLFGRDISISDFRTARRIKFVKTKRHTLFNQKLKLPVTDY